MRTRPSAIRSQASQVASLVRSRAVQQRAPAEIAIERTEPPNGRQTARGAVFWARPAGRRRAGRFQGFLGVGGPVTRGGAEADERGPSGDPIATSGDERVRFLRLI